MKRKAAEHPNLPPSAIFRQEVAQVQAVEVVMSLPQRNDIMRTINRAQNRNRPKNPRSLVDLEVTEPYNTTLNNQQFLQFDGDDDDGNRLLIFYTVDGLVKLSNSQAFFVTAPLKLCPTCFSNFTPYMVITWVMFSHLSTA